MVDYICNAIIISYYFHDYSKVFNYNLQIKNVRIKIILSQYNKYHINYLYTSLLVLPH